jgi:hypothetical protein
VAGVFAVVEIVRVVVLGPLPPLLLVQLSVAGENETLTPAGGLLLLFVQEKFDGLKVTLEGLRLLLFTVTV